MSSITKTIIAISAGAGLAGSTMVAKKHPGVFEILPASQGQYLSPVILNQDGTVRFLDRIPSPEVAMNIREAAASNDFEKLNSQLAEYGFYVLPENFVSSSD